MIDFHCHIFTPGSTLPVVDGEYYQTIKPLAGSGGWLDHVWQETVETVADNFRSGPALRRLKQMSPLIYSEMVRRMNQATPYRLMLEMARHHVRQAIVVAMDPIVPTDEVLTACASSNGQLLPFGSVDPWVENWEERLILTLSLPIAGFKFHSNIQKLPLGHERMHEILAVMAIEEFAKPIFLHTGDYPIYKPQSGDWAVDLRKILAEYPTLNFVCGHCGWNRPAAALKAARRYPNVWLETSWQPPQMIRRLCDLLGAHRFVLGSDYPLYSMKRAIRNCRIVLTPREFETISEEVPRMLLKGSRPYA